MATVSEKICVVCEQNVSGKPRTKDALGNYYCNPCWANQANKRTQAPPPPVTARRAVEQTEFEISSPDSLDAPDAFDDPLADLAAAAQPLHSVGVTANQTDWFECPMCHSQVTGAKMDVNGVCTDCARNGRVQAPSRSIQTLSDRGPNWVVWAGVATVVLLAAIGGYFGFQRYQYSRYVDSVTPLLDALDRLTAKTKSGIEFDEMDRDLKALTQVHDSCESSLSKSQARLPSWLDMDVAVSSYQVAFTSWQAQRAGYGTSLEKSADESTIQAMWGSASSEVKDVHQDLARGK